MRSAPALPVRATSIDEQNIRSALGLAGRVYVMKSGRLVLEKRADELLAAQDSWWELY